jgi:uncharacterized RDD family membrane protein YckC
MICTNHPDVTEGVRHCSRCGFAYCGDCLVTIGGLPYCAMCKNEQLLDVRSGVDSTVLDYATIGRRFAAAVIDSFIVNLPLIAVVFAILSGSGLTLKGGMTRNPLWYLPAVASVIYQAAMLKARGQTLGKMAMKVKVVRPDGSAITGGQAWGREVLRFVLGFLYIIDYIPALFTDDRKTLHDMLASTRVVNWT